MHPLSWHVYGAHHEITSLLLKHGANVNDDVDSMYDPAEKLTALDLAEVILESLKAQPESDISNAQHTYDILVQNGGKKYQDLFQEF